MKDLARRIAAEKENVEKALQNLAEARARKDRSAIELFVHAYGFMLEGAQLEPLACDIPNLGQEFIGAIERYCRDLGGAPW